MTVKNAEAVYIMGGSGGQVRKVRKPSPALEPAPEIEDSSERIRLGFPGRNGRVLIIPGPKPCPRCQWPPPDHDG